MLASMPRLYGASEARKTDSEARRVARKPSQIDVTVTSAQGAETPVVIGDISSHGCSIGRDADWLKQGVFVWLRAGSEAAIIGIVRWIREETAGIEFVRPLAPGAYGLASLIDDEAD
jgi:hypothetical protein